MMVLRQPMAAPPPVQMLNSSVDIPPYVVGAHRDPSYTRHVALEFAMHKMIGSGTFGNVYVARMGLASESVAIKRVKKEIHYRETVVEALRFFLRLGSDIISKFRGRHSRPVTKSRELDILRILDHPNVIYMKYYFLTTNEMGEEFMHFVMEYVPKSLYSVILGCSRTHQNVPRFLCKVYAWQLLRALNYLHSQDICHRDVKSHNILIDPHTNNLKLADFGSAKKLHLNEPNVSYICSRYYRAPELLLNFTHYTTAIDMWSFGICLIEMITGETPFNGQCEASQFMAIAQVLGTPPSRLLREMNLSLDDCNLILPGRPEKKLKEALPSSIPSNGFKLLKTVLTYDWTQRATALELCTHDFFDEIKNERYAGNLPNGIFCWENQEFDPKPELRNKIIPRYVRHGSR